MKINKLKFSKALIISTTYFFITGIIIVSITWISSEPYNIPHRLAIIELSKDIFLLIATAIIIFLAIQYELNRHAKYKILLQEEIKRYQSLFENAQDAIIIMNDLTITEFNEQALNLFKCGKNDFTGRSLTSLISVQQENENISCEQADQLIRRVLIENQESIQLIMQQCNNFRFYAEISFSSASYGGILYNQAIIRDISQLKLSAKALEMSEERYRDIVQNANIVIQKLDTSGNIIFFNKYAQSIFGFREDEIVGKNVIGTIFSENDLKSGKPQRMTYTEWVKELIAGIDQHQSVETWNTDKDGKRLYIEWSNVPTYNEEGVFSGVLCFGTNRTEQKQTLDKLIESEHKFRLIFNAVSDGISFTSNFGGLIEVNDVVLKQFGLTRKEFYFRDPADRWPIDLRNRLTEIINQASTRDEAYFEFDFKSDTGLSYQIEVSTKKIIFDGIEGFIGVSREISERKHQQKMIYNAVIGAEEQERSRIARDLHDGVAPILSAVKLYVQSLKKCRESGLRTEIHRKIEETINESIQSVSDISNNLSPHVLRNFGLETAVNSFINRIADSKEISILFRTNINERLDEILEITLYRTIIELLNNTLKHAQATNVRIELLKNEKISLNYIDNGTGVDKEKLNTGMGMFNISYRVKSLNGTINTITDSEKGFRIQINIPLNE